MIVIPNMEKPKSCYNHCEFIAMEEVGCPLKDYAESHQYKDKIHPACPLIEIVTCSECKHLEVINGAKIYAHCPMWEIDFYPFEDDTRANYCSWGERANATQHTQCVESALNRESCNLAYYGICTDGDCNKCPYEEIEIDEPNAGGWIPLHFDGMTSDYPYDMDGKWVLVTDGKNISVERIKKDAQDHFLPNGRWFELEEVIAWRPLPEPYEMERSE